MTLIYIDEVTPTLTSLPLCGVSYSLKVSPLSCASLESGGVKAGPCEAEVV